LPPVGAPNLKFDGGYAQASYVLTGESHPYNASSASYGGIAPANPFSLTGGGWGAWEIAARELAQNQPRFIVDVESRSKTPRYPMSKYPPLAQLLETRYRLVEDLPDGVVYQRTSP
jgi:hypothetical protein